MYGFNHAKIISFSYSDGSGNAYIISGEKERILEYKPVKPQFSSSGYYDGGAEVRATLDDTQYNNLVSVLHKAIKNEAIHLEHRVMGSGFVAVTDDKGRTTYILKSDSTEKTEFEKALKEIVE